MSIKVLIVEDEALVALTLEDALSEAGYQVCGVVARSAPALACARASAIDLAVIDVRLAEGDDGIELAHQLANIQPGMLIMFATGNPALVRERARVGRGCLAKPFDVDWLLGALALIMQGVTPDCPGYFSLDHAVG